MTLGESLYLSEPVSTFKDGDTTPSLEDPFDEQTYYRGDAWEGRAAMGNPPVIHLHHCSAHPWKGSLCCSGVLSPRRKERSWHRTYVACTGIRLPRTPQGTIADVRFLKQSENLNWKTLEGNVLTFHVVIIKPRCHHSQKNLVFLKIEKKSGGGGSICTVCGRNRYKHNLWSRQPWAGVSAPWCPRWATPGKRLNLSALAIPRGA